MTPTAARDLRSQWRLARASTGQLTCCAAPTGTFSEAGRILVTAQGHHGHAAVLLSSAGYLPLSDCRRVCLEA
jgi:hypothetical protein